MTWEQVLPEIDKLMDQYADLINTDPQHGLFYQQRMAVWACYRQEVVAKIRKDKPDFECYSQMPLMREKS